jgi:hypothetical protein
MAGRSPSDGAREEIGDRPASASCPSLPIVDCIHGSPVRYGEAGRAHANLADDVAAFLDAVGLAKAHLLVALIEPFLRGETPKGFIQ